MQERQQQLHRVVAAWPSSIPQNDKSVTGATLQRSRPFKQSKTDEKNKCSCSASLLTTGLLQNNRQQVRSAMRAGCKTSTNFTYLLHCERHADAVLLNQHSPRVVVMAAGTGRDVGSKSVKQIKPLRSTDTPNPSPLHQKHPLRDSSSTRAEAQKGLTTLLEKSWAVSLTNYSNHTDCACGIRLHWFKCEEIRPNSRRSHSQQRLRAVSGGLSRPGPAPVRWLFSSAFQPASGSFQFFLLLTAPSRDAQPCRVTA